MSPEQASGQTRLVDLHTDIYSLGVIFYQLLCGHVPFHGETVLVTLGQVLNEEPRAPRGINQQIPRELETICLKAMAKKPDERYATAAALADDLERWEKGQAIIARPQRGIARWWQSVGRSLRPKQD
jgi:eukaryotic-like serine/threonine-protein kinase